MTPLIVVAILVVVVVWWSSYKPGQKDEVIDRAKAIGGKVKLPGLPAGWGDKIRFRGREKELPRQFKEWAAGQDKAQFDLEAFKSWLGTLPAPELETFSRRVRSFCAEQGFELDWLFEADLSNSPVLKQNLGELVLLYSLADWKAAQAQAEIKVFNTFQSWQAGKEDKALTQQLFTRLVEKELLPAPPTELFLAPEKKREAYMVQAIRRFAGQDRQALNAILKEILFVPAPALPAGSEEQKQAEKDEAAPADLAPAASN